MYVLNSEITIGNHKFSGAYEVTVNRSVHNIDHTATIKLPSIGKIIRNGRAENTTVITADQFSVGQQVTIKLGYNGELKEEFRGFVSGINTDMPLQITCEGYSWLLKKNQVDVFYPKISLAELMKVAVSGLDQGGVIKVKCEADIQFVNVELSRLNGLQAIKRIRAYTDDALCCFFIEPDVLWVGLPYQQIVSGATIANNTNASYRVGYNTVKTTLKLNGSQDNKLKVVYTRQLSGGGELKASSAVFPDATAIHAKVLTNIADKPHLEMLAEEKAYSGSYDGFDGSLTAFLQPYVLPGSAAYFEDKRYRERNGYYLVESTNVSFSTKGARRVVELGPKIRSTK